MRYGYWGVFKYLAMQLLGHSGWFLVSCYAVTEVFFCFACCYAVTGVLFFICYYAVTWVFWVIRFLFCMLLCSY